MMRNPLPLPTVLALALGGCSPAGAPDAEGPTDLLSETASPEDCLLLVWSSQEKPRAQFDRTHDFVDGGAISCATGTSASQFDAAIAEVLLQLARCLTATEQVRDPAGIGGNRLRD